MNVLKNKLNFLNRTAKNYNQNEWYQRYEPNGRDNLRYYFDTLKEFQILLEGYNIATDKPLKLVIDETIYKSNDPHYICEVNTYKLENESIENSESLYSSYTKRMTVQNIDISKLDFENMTSSMGIMKIPYNGTNEDAKISLLIGDDAEVTLYIEYNEPLENVHFDDIVIMDVELGLEEGLELFKQLYLHSTLT